ncbi:hypothetical protein DIPPA_14930 [Diplonema papillatum]|nr:hypothetical protein DIPPA_14930 [Diplonema papillatum]|eukprot:gene18514-28574_t
MHEDYVQEDLRRALTGLRDRLSLSSPSVPSLRAGSMTPSPGPRIACRRSTRGRSASLSSKRSASSRRNVWDTKPSAHDKLVHETYEQSVPRPDEIRHRTISPARTTPGLSPAPIRGLSASSPADCAYTASVMNSEHTICRCPTRTAGRLLQLAVLKKWPTSKLATVAEFLTKTGITNPTLRFRRELSSVMDADEFSLFMELQFNDSACNLFTYGHLMNETAWRELGVPKALEHGERQGAVLQHHTLLFNHEDPMKTVAHRSLKRSRFGIANVREARGKYAHGVVHATSPQAVIAAASRLPGCRLVRATALTSESCIAVDVFVFVTLRPFDPLAPSPAYLNLMVQAAPHLLPPEYVANLEALMSDRHESAETDRNRHRALFLSRALG